jgi:hypothetical protein
MSARREEILYEAVHGDEALHLGGRLEAPRLARALARRLRGDFRSIVRVLVRHVDHGRRGSIAVIAGGLARHRLLCQPELRLDNAGNELIDGVSSARIARRIRVVRVSADSSTSTTMLRDSSRRLKRLG